MALPVVFIEIGASGIRLVVRLFLHRQDSTGLGASYGTQQQVNHRVAEAMVAERQEASTRLAQDMPAPDITLTQDETFTGGLCLVGIELASNSILRAHRRGTRSRRLECISEGRALRERAKGLRTSLFEPPRAWGELNLGEQGRLRHKAMMLA